jgi:glycosyltransferase involved in cell wall biosynthesis
MPLVGDKISIIGIFVASSRLKILHVGHAPLPAGYAAHSAKGWHPARWVLNHALAQSVHPDIQPEILVQVPGADGEITSEEFGVKIHYLPAPTKLRAATFFFFDQRRLAKKIKEIAPDLVHAHGTEEAYALAAQCSGLPYVITGQGLIFAINREMPPGWMSRMRIQEITERMAFVKARFAIAKTHYIRDLLGEEFPHLDITFIPNTFDPKLLTVSESRHPGQLIFCGNFVPRKGIHILREALQVLARQGRLSGVSLKVIGNSMPGQESEYEARETGALRELLGDRLLLLGKLPQLELARHVAGAHAMVAPSLEDSLGNAAVEAVLLGTHALVSKDTGMERFLSRFGNITALPVNQPEAWAERIADLVRSGELPEGEPARGRLIAETGPEAVAGAHDKLYQRILENW